MEDVENVEWRVWRLGNRMENEGYVECSAEGGFGQCGDAQRSGVVYMWRCSVEVVLGRGEMNVEC